MFEDDDDEESIACLYCDGHWEWDTATSGLKFISDVVAESQQTVFIPAAVVGPIEFKDNLDVLEQQKFRRRIQRKFDGEEDVVTLQDVKDIVLYTAPAALVTPMIINALHTQTADRFLRALILYCQYYVQISEIMSERGSELETKIPTERSSEIEADYRDNLTDLRLLVAKEYCNMLLGGCDFKKFHHMGKGKKQRSMSKREAMLFEPLIRLSVQIVWVAIGRKNYQQLELEINRLFRSKKFNIVEHNTTLLHHMECNISQQEQNVRVGNCVRADRSMRMRSPFYNEIECVREIDFRMFGLGVIDFKGLNERLRYLESFLITEEAEMQSNDISLGIVGLQRNRFDILLREIQRQPDEGKISSHSYTLHRAVSNVQRSGRNSTTSKKSVTSVKRNLYLPICLPSKETMPMPAEFPEKCLRPLLVNEAQRLRWLNRTSKIKRHRSTVIKTQDTGPK